MTPMKHSAAFCFVDGSLTVKGHGWGEQEGNGHFAFSDDDLQYEQDDCSSKVSRWTPISRSDLIELRDFLNKQFPMQVYELRDALKKFSFIDKQPWMADLEWELFRDDPVAFFMRAAPETAERLWRAACEVPS